MLNIPPILQLAHTLPGDDSMSLVNGQIIRIQRADPLSEGWVHLSGLQVTQDINSPYSKDSDVCVKAIAWVGERS